MRFKEKRVRLMRGDCLERMKEIPSSSVDMVLADVPYGTTACKWDSIIPVALMEYLIKTYTNEGETVLDFTMGSGPTGVACANTGRKFRGIELDRGYFKIARDRIKEALE